MGGLGFRVGGILGLGSTVTLFDMRVVKYPSERLVTTSVAVGPRAAEFFFNGEPAVFNVRRKSLNRTIVHFRDLGGPGALHFLKNFTVGFVGSQGS